MHKRCTSHKNWLHQVTFLGILEKFKEIDVIGRLEKNIWDNTYTRLSSKYKFASILQSKINKYTAIRIFYNYAIRV